MEYQKIINLLDNIPNEPFKFRTRNWVEINDESRGTYNASNEIKFKTSMIRSNLCDYIDAQIHVKVTIEVPNTGTAAPPNNKNKFINYTSEMNKTQVDDARDIDLVMPMYNLIEYSDTFTKTSRSLYQFHRDKPALTNICNIIDFSNDNSNSISFKYKQQITRQT